MAENTFVPEGQVPKFPPGTDPERAVIAPNMTVSDLEHEMGMVMKGVTHAGVILALHNGKVLSTQITSVMNSIELLARGLDRLAELHRKQNERVETLISNQKYLFDELIVEKYKNGTHKRAKKGSASKEVEASSEHTPQ